MPAIQPTDALALLKTASAGDELADASLGLTPPASWSEGHSRSEKSWRPLATARAMATSHAAAGVGAHLTIVAVTPDLHAETPATSFGDTTTPGLVIEAVPAAGYSMSPSTCFPRCCFYFDARGTVRHVADLSDLHPQRVCLRAFARVTPPGRTPVKLLHTRARPGTRKHRRTGR